MSSRLVVCAVCLLTIFLSGCGWGGKDEEVPATFPVTGTLTYEGQPVKDGLVTFHPQGPGNPATGRVAENGRFTLTTYKDKDGAVPGFHVVTVEVFPEGALPGMETETAGVMSIPKKYADTGTSPMTVEVKKEPNNLTLVLED